MPLRAVIDTNVVYAGLRSRNGASYQILDALERRLWTMVLSNTVLTEYEEILKREAPTIGIALDHVDLLLDSLCLHADQWPTSETWSPILPDPDDEAFVQLAFESRADYLVSFNLTHLAPANALGINLLAPKEFFQILKT
jgi:putative PIN family toxin of toxin-antitoxin system